jgi:conjugal transfer pilus assembly protein TraK
MFQKLKNLLKTIPLSLIISVNAHATQRIVHADKSHQQVNISAHEQNRLAIEDRRIVSVVPSQKGVISVIKDEALGALYFTLSSETHHGSITLFVSDDQGATYKLILHPKSIPGTEIILQPTINGHRSLKSGGYAGSYSVDIVRMNREVKLWKESRFIFLEKYLGIDGLIGEKYRLTNISPSEMRIEEQEFYRDGILAVSLEKHSLASGESSHVFIIRAGEKHDS